MNIYIIKHYEWSVQQPSSNIVRELSQFLESTIPNILWCPFQRLSSLAPLLLLKTHRDHLCQQLVFLGKSLQQLADDFQFLDGVLLSDAHCTKLQTSCWAKKTCLPPPVAILQRHIFLDSMRHWAFLDILGSTWQLWHSCCDTRRVPRRIDGSGENIHFGDFLKNSRPCEKCAEAILGFFGFFGPTLGSNGIQPEIQTLWPATISHAKFRWFLWDSPGKKMISRSTFVFRACCITRFFVPSMFHSCFGRNHLHENLCISQRCLVDKALVTLSRLPSLSSSNSRLTSTPKVARNG